jgi:hypothetical protein
MVFYESCAMSPVKCTNIFRNGVEVKIMVIRDVVIQ